MKKSRRRKPIIGELFKKKKKGKGRKRRRDGRGKLSRNL